MSEEDPDRERRLRFFREHFLPRSAEGGALQGNVRASWIRIRRRMTAKAIQRRWKR